MSYVPPHGNTWWREPKCRFLLCLPHGWRVTHSSEADRFAVVRTPEGPGWLRGSIVQARPEDEGIRVREVVRAGAAAHAGGSYSEALGVARAQYSCRKQVDGRNLYVYYWEYGAARWVCVWTYAIDIALHGTDAVRRDYAEASFIADSFALA